MKENVQTIDWCWEDFAKPTETHANGAVPRSHGNKGNRMPNLLSFEDVMCVVNFVMNYENLNGVPQPAAARAIDNAPPTYLQCSTTKKTVHADYTHNERSEVQNIRAILEQLGPPYSNCFSRG